MLLKELPCWDLTAADFSDFTSSAESLLFMPPKSRGMSV